MKIKSILKELLSASLRLKLRLAAHKLSSFRYAGGRVYCPCCARSFSQFLQFGGRANRRCPYCLSLERTRLLWLYLEQELNIRTEAYSILHFAPEPALQDRLKQLPQLAYLSTDLDSPLAMVHFDIKAIPLQDNSYDLLLNSHVLAHVDDDLKALQEMHRVLKPGGRLLVQALVFPTARTLEDPIANRTAAGRLALYGQADRFRNYGLDLTMRLQEAGFLVEENPYWENWNEAERLRLGITEEAAIYVCRKPSF